mmetsp:Transcript_6580/g.12392  ORF Transcript_6580/g.12392 Transcript_6580/m.12392 type:complete len:378 (+) Transcript_6580:537-1670(+)
MITRILCEQQVMKRTHQCLGCQTIFGERYTILNSCPYWTYGRHISWNLFQKCQSASFERGRLIAIVGVHGVTQSLAVLLCVTQEHPVVFLEEQRIVNTSISRGHGSLHHDALLRLPHMKDGHASKSTVGIVNGIRVDDIVGTQDQRNVALLEVVVDLVHLQHDIVGDTSLSQKHVQLTRHTPGDGVNTESDPHSVLIQRLHHLGQRILTLCNSQTVPRDDNNLGSLCQHAHHLTKRCLLVDSSVNPSGPLRSGVSTKQHVCDTAVHRHAHDVGQNGTGGTNQGPNDQQHAVLHHETFAHQSPAGVAVKHCDTHRHISTSDGIRQVPSGSEREPGRCQKRHEGVIRCHSRADVTAVQTQGCHQSGDIDQVLPWQAEGL